MSLPTETVTVTRAGPTETVPAPKSPSPFPSGTAGPEPSDSPGPSSEGWITTFKGPVTLVASPTDLDDIPPFVGRATDVQVIGYVGGVYLKAWNFQSMAKLGADDPDPTPVACGALIDASSPNLNRLAVSPGDRLCLRTDRDRIALIDITDTTVRADDNSSAAAYVAVWTGPETSA
ncbi:hypothetical protein OG548_24375 [Streptomyces sp. NBC_01356]|uniref:hypothetical protein n=1 Tax=Streptomyces sp. NBC_01356 TaxID=2903836 RepID=UPI002E2EE5CF|nr:hypothetical protein [Streptomyces sp. NBC_01356]